MIYFNSTAIHAAEYDACTNLLQITFTSSPKIYDYPGVPEHIFGGLLAASSKGTYFNDHIRDQYTAF